MNVHRPGPAAVLTSLAALALIVTAVAPALAAPTGPDASRTTLAQPQECDEITVDAEGAIVVGGVVLTEEQLGSVDADVLAALALAAAAQAAGMGLDSLCVDVETGAEAVTVNGDIHVCSVVEVGVEGNVTLAGIDVDPQLLNAEVMSLLQGAAALAEEACVDVRVDANEVVALVEVDGCATATLNESESVTVELGGAEVELPVEAFTNLEGQLEVGVAVETRLSIFAELALETGELVFQAGIADFHFCDAPTSGQVLVEKRVNPTGDPFAGRGEPGGPGWTFDFAITGGEIVAESPTTDEDGLAFFDYTTGPGATITLTELLRDGYQLMDRVCQPISDQGEPLAPVGVWTGTSVTFPAEPGVRTVCVFLNAPTDPVPTGPPAAPAPTNPPAAAPTGGQASATDRPTITLPPTDRTVSRADSQASWPGLVLLTLGLVVAAVLLPARRRHLRRR